jgi:putative transposase
MKNPSSYLKLRVLGAIEYAQGGTIRERIRKVADEQFLDEDGMPRKFTWRTISTWLYRYKARGVTGLDVKPRGDKGTTRKVTPEELMEAISQLLPQFRDRKYNKMELYRACVEQNILHKERIAQTTFYRFIREYDLLSKNEITLNKRRLAFAMQYANQLWQADTLVGPYIKDESGRSVQAKLIAFIDDATRVICHGEFFLNDNTECLISCYRSALYKRGIPDSLYCDNGSNYSSLELKLVCDRIGTILKFTPVRDGSSKGKIERFFRTVRDKFLSHNLELSSLAALNRQFTRWLEDDYNSVVHSALGMKPIDRFGLDLKRIRYLPPSKENDELFYAEDTRSVKNDNTFSFKKIRFETPCDLRNKEIAIRFDRRNPTDQVIVYYKNQRMGVAKPLDLISNGLSRQHKKEVSA